MKPFYTIPIVTQNLHRDETVVQVADALKHFINVSNDIFNRIDKRIETNTSRLTTLTKRIEVAKLNVSTLRGAKKATCVFSSNKYPPVHLHQQYVSIYHKNHDIFLSRSKIKLKNNKMNDEPLETLQFYHVKVEKDSKDYSGTDGLGNIPVDLNAVNDLLMYNTGRNPYSSYFISDHLQMSLSSKREEVIKTSGIGAPPTSLIERATISKPMSDVYLYSPNLGNVPLIDVPLDLPDLPGIADDLRYVDQVGSVIAPSVTTTPLEPNLPLFVPDYALDDDTPDLPSVPIELLEEITVLQEFPKVDDIQSASSRPENITSLNSYPEVHSNDILPEVNDAHSSLMEAIRQAGGNTASKMKQSETKMPPTGDFMADLHTKLLLRRKGISGLKNQEPNGSTNTNLDANTTMKKISAMIPPPPTDLEQSDSTNTEDEDWDDD